MSAVWAVPFTCAVAPLVSTLATLVVAIVRDDEFVPLLFVGAIGTILSPLLMIIALLGALDCLDAERRSTGQVSRRARGRARTIGLLVGVEVLLLVALLGRL